MIITVVAFAVVIWAICGVLAYGVTLHDFQDGWPDLAWSKRYGDMAFSLLVATLGPIGLFAALLSWAVFHRAPLGLRYRCLSHDESWAAHQREFPGLSYEEFLR